MNIGIGLPTAIPHTDGSLWVPWARKAEAAGFTSLSTIGRTVFDSHEELIVLAAAAAVTTKVKLVPTVMIGPPRENVLLAKQAATLHNLSKGRLVLGLGIGWRPDDFEVVGRGDDWKRRGRLLEQQISDLRRIWAEHFDLAAQQPGLLDQTAAQHFVGALLNARFGWGCRCRFSHASD